MTRQRDPIQDLSSQAGAPRPEATQPALQPYVPNPDTRSAPKELALLPAPPADRSDRPGIISLQRVPWGKFALAAITPSGTTRLRPVGMNKQIVLSEPNNTRTGQNPSPIVRYP
jgi:hypothetical protein